MKAFFLNTNLKEIRTGIEESALKRTFYFKKHLDLTPVYVTSVYDSRGREVFEELKKNKKIEESTQLVNMYRYYQEKSLLTEYQQEKYYETDRNLNIVKVENHNDYRYLDSDGRIVMYNKRNLENKTIFNNYFSYVPNKTTHRRDYYDTFSGLISKTQYLEDGNTRFEIFYTTERKACIYKTYGKNDEKKNVLKTIELLDENQQVKALFYTEADFVKYWYAEYFGGISEDEISYIIVDRTVNYSKAIEACQKDNLKTIFLMHSSHMAACTSPIKGPLNSNYAHLLNNHRIADAIVVFTKKQKKHIQNRFGYWKNIHVIPHNLEEIPNKVEFKERNLEQIIYLGRFSILKNQISLIRAFEIVLKEFPNAKLDLYGEGDKNVRGNAISYVKEKKLENSIAIHSYTNESQKIYNEATIAVLPSKVEGFSLFVLESLSHGLPIVSYDIDYGPSDMIRNEKNGYLIQPFDERKLANAIVKLLKNPKLREKMSEESYRISENFTVAKVSEQWKNLITLL